MTSRQGRISIQNLSPFCDGLGDQHWRQWYHKIEKAWVSGCILEVSHPTRNVYLGTLGEKRAFVMLSHCQFEVVCYSRWLILTKTINICWLAVWTSFNENNPYLYILYPLQYLYKQAFNDLHANLFCKRIKFSYLFWGV